MASSKVLAAAAVALGAFTVCDAFSAPSGAVLGLSTGAGLRAAASVRSRADAPQTVRMMQTEVCRDDEIEEGGRKVVKTGGVTVVVAKHEGKTYAFNNKCPHLGLSLKRGEITSSDDRNGVCITCPYHKSKFSLEEDGKCKIWSESVFGIKGTEALGEAVGGFIAPMAKSVNPLGKKAAPAVVYKTSVENGNIMVDLPPDLSNYAMGDRIYKGYMEYDQKPKKEE
mmetsp:Transcript_43173/g.108059  ORF Transcript_43173/g.108059 Transcript_43173/m.108059 type:complete len:225 (-) Transcript_43173:226-900(-)|eukprot:CAMPEP_0173419218 /NCGR_PEP_ID=MMETSP1357-20121228/1143_1 /TAXON_ID=77926 /ORGANISM="Hemiselmis rufescens, Strain PCC563" /LENGTH=224 /DNA_ID=CAMNT_0014381829 /DNA_START=21 /DNA_END=695 /DNA_ORIENTATION=-